MHHITFSFSVNCLQAAPSILSDIQLTCIFIDLIAISLAICVLYLKLQNLTSSRLKLMLDYMYLTYANYKHNYVYIARSKLIFNTFYLSLVFICSILHVGL